MGEQPVLHVTHSPHLICIPTEYSQNISKGNKLESYGANKVSPAKFVQGR